MAGLFYDYDTDDTVSMNSLDSDSSGECLFNHRAALAEQEDDESEFGPDRALPIFQHYEERLQKLESTLAELAFNPDRDWAEGYIIHLETNDRPTILRAAAHFKARYERFLNQYPEMCHGIDTNAANEPFGDHGDDDTDEDQQPALNQSPPDAPIVGSPVVIESVSELVLGLGSVSISPSGLAPSYAPIAGSAVVQEPEGDADVAEPPARRRRVLPETFFGFQVFFKPWFGNDIVVWTLPSDTVAVLKGKVTARIGVPEDYFEFVYQGTQLEDAFTLPHYNIGRDCTVHLTHRLRGGGKRSYAEMEEDDPFPAVGEAFSVDDELAAIFGDIGDTGARGSDDPVPAGGPLAELEPPDSILSIRGIGWTALSGPGRAENYPFLLK